MTPRRIEVEIDRLVVEDPTLARPGEVAGAIERELGRLLATGAPLGTSSGPNRSARAVGTAIGRAIGQKLAR